MSHPIESLDPHSLSVTRRAPGGYIQGTWKAGKETPLTIVATVQATDPRTAQLLPEGKRNKAAWTIHTETALQPLNEKAGQPADLVWINGRPYEITLCWDHTSRTSELAYFKAVITEINTVNGPSDFALAGETIPAADLPLSYRPITGIAGRLYITTTTEEDARGYVGPSRSGAAAGEIVTFTLPGHVHPSITGTPGLEMFAYDGGYTSDFADVEAEHWAMPAGVSGINGIVLSRGTARKGNVGALWDYTETFTLVADQAEYLFGEGTSHTGSIGSGALTDAPSAIVQWGSSTLIPDSDYVILSDRIQLVSPPSAQDAALDQPLYVRVKQHS